MANRSATPISWTLKKENKGQHSAGIGGRAGQHDRQSELVLSQLIIGATSSPEPVQIG